MINSLVYESMAAERNGVKLIHFLDALPGVGKTKKAIEWMAHNVDGVSVYVAPRVKLLDEVARRLSTYRAKSDFPRTKKYLEADRHGRLHVVSSDRAISKGTTTAQLLKSHLENAVPGRIILCTHQAFVESVDLDFDKIEEIQKNGMTYAVFFDEARKLVLEQRNQSIAVTPNQRAIALRVLDKYAHPVVTDNGKYTGFCRYNAPPENQTVLVRKVRNAVTKSVDGKNIGVETGDESDLVQFVSSVCNPRLDVYVRRSQSLEEELQGSKSTRMLESIFSITSPARIFNSFRVVVMMSAYFRESQMYHLLRNAGKHCPEDHHRVELKEIKGVLDEQRKTIRSRLRQVTIYPLLKRDNKISVTHLKHSCLVPSEKMKEFYARVHAETGVEPANVYKTMMTHDSWSSKRKVIRSKAKDIREIAGEIVGDSPLVDQWERGTTLEWWRCGYSSPALGYFRMSQFIANQLRLHRGTSSGDLPYGHFVTGAPLVSLNKRVLGQFQHVVWHRAHESHDLDLQAYQRLHSSDVDWKRKVRDEIVDGVDIRSVLLREPTEDQLDAENERAERGEYLLGPRYEGNHGALGTEFDVVIADPMGLNGYRTRNFIAYLAARNPSPGVQALLEALLPQYDPELDYAGESALQAVTRLSVRAPERDERVYVVVPDTGLAQIVRHKLSYLVRKVGNDGEEVRVRRGAKIDLSFANQFDMVDVLDAHRQNFQSLDRVGVKKRVATNEIKRTEWPHDVLVLHNQLNEAAARTTYLNVLKRGVKRTPNALAFVAHIMRMNDFCVLAEQFLKETKHPDGKLSHAVVNRRLALNREVLQKRLAEANAVIRKAEKRTKP